MVSRGMTVRCVTFCTSTSGDEPVTVTVSSRAPTVRSALIVAVKPADNSMPSRLTMEKPASVKAAV